MAADAAMAASQMVAFLSPFLPYLLKLGEAAAEEAGSRLGASAWERAKLLWARLAPAIGPDERALAATERLAAAPERRELQWQLGAELGRLLQQDPGLATELGRLLRDRPPSGPFRGVVQRGPVTDSVTFGVVEGNVTYQQGTDLVGGGPGRRPTGEPE